MSPMTIVKIPGLRVSGVELTSIPYPGLVLDQLHTRSIEENVFIRLMITHHSRIQRPSYYYLLNIQIVTKCIFRY